MADTLLTLNTSVPNASHMATPSLVMHDNGDWEIAFSGDVDYISRTSPSFIGSETVIEILTELRLMNDYDHLDEDDDNVILFLDLVTNVGSPSEAVYGFWIDGVAEVMERSIAEKLVEKDEKFHNFIPFVEIIEEVRKFVSYHRSHYDELREEMDEDYEGDEDE